MANITTELATIHDDPLGRNVKQAIYDALNKVNTDVEQFEPEGGVPVGHMSVGFLNGYIAPYRLGFMGENPSPEYVWIKSTDTRIMPVRDGWCVIEERIEVSTEDSSYETGTISDSGSHTWTNLANYKLLGDTQGNSFSYCHLWITRLSAGESITLSGDRQYSFMGFLIQNGAQQGYVSAVDSDILETPMYPAPRIVSEDYTTTVHFVSDSIPHMGNDNCSVTVSPDYANADRYPSYGSGGKLFMFVRNDSSDGTVFFVENSGTLIPFFSGGTAITTFALG